MIFIILFLSVIYLAFLITVYNGIKKLPNQTIKNTNSLTISLIIPFRNEAEKILNSLNSIQKQTLSADRFEVIYIDDNSDDDSIKILNENITSSNIRILENSSSILKSHKKSAIELGIKNATNEIIVLTDADCVHKPEWLETIIKEFDHETAIVSGPVEFTSDGSLFQELQKLEFASLIIVGAGLIGSKSPTICNSANLAFRKKVFYEVGGYEDNKNLSSGDDEFLMQKISNETDYKIKFCSQKEAIVQTAPNKTLKEFIEQRKRWASKGIYYKDVYLILKLILIYLFYISIPFVIFIGGFIDPVYVVLGILVFILKVISEYSVMKLGLSKIFNIYKINNYLIAQIIHIPYIILSPILGLFGSYVWKGRRIRK